MCRWQPLAQGSRPVGRPTARWEDSLNRFAKNQGFSWRKVAKDRMQWSRLEEGFVGFEA